MVFAHWRCILCEGSLVLRSVSSESRQIRQKLMFEFFLSDSCSLLYLEQWGKRKQLFKFFYQNYSLNFTAGVIEIPPLVLEGLKPLQYFDFIQVLTAKLINCLFNRNNQYQLNILMLFNLM